MNVSNEANVVLTSPCLGLSLSQAPPTSTWPNWDGGKTHLPSWGSPCTGEAGRAETLSGDSLKPPLPPQVLQNPVEVGAEGGGVSAAAGSSPERYFIIQSLKALALAPSLLH